MRAAGKKGNIRQEYVEEGVRETDEHPREPDQGGGNGNLLAAEQAAKMDQGLTGREAIAAVSRANIATCLQPLKSQGARTVVLSGQLLKVLDQLLLLTGTEKIFGSFLEADNQDSGKRHGEDQGTTSEHGVSPAPVVGLGTGSTLGIAVPFGGSQETPGNEARDGLAKTPPSSHERH